MASEGNTALNEGIPQLKDAFVVIVRTEWNDSIVGELEKGCCRVLDQQGVRYRVINVPGAVEIPFAIRAYAHSIQLPADAFIALGTVIRGDTPHFDYVCQSVTHGITELNLELSAPVIFGILTVNTEAQAHERLGGIHGHKGEEAAVTALKMIAYNRSLQ